MLAMATTTVWMDQTTQIKLKKMCDELGLSQSSFIRMIIREKAKERANRERLLQEGNK